MKIVPLHWLLTGIIMSVSLVGSFAQSGSELEPGYYITVGAYAKEKEDYAQRFVKTLNEKGFSAGYGFNEGRNLYFVYLEFFSDLKQSIKKMLEVRAQGEFTDAWVHVIPGYVKTSTSSTQDKAVVETQPIPEQPKELAQQVTSANPSSKVIDSATQKSTKDSTTVDANESVSENVKEESNEDKIIQYDPMTLGNTEVFFSLFNATNNRIVEGNVQVIDAERAKLLKELPGNEYVILPDPKSSSGQVSLIADVFGYRKIQQEFNYKKPLQDTASKHIELMGTTFVVNFDLVRYRKGDISTLYNVYFFNDAAVMLPISKYELTSLLDMMKENSNYRIKLHGHTNGNYHGKIIALGPEKNFFSLDGSKQMIGSAKDLSFQRANTIKEYLIANGIEESRMEIKAWGGKRPIFDKHSANAKKNVRVEVEVLQE